MTDINTDLDTEKINIKVRKTAHGEIKAYVKDDLDAPSLYIWQMNDKLGVQMTKEIFVKDVSKAVPVVGEVVSREISFETYKPMLEKLKKYLAPCGLQMLNITKSLMSKLLLYSLEYISRYVYGNRF